MKSKLLDFEHEIFAMKQLPGMIFISETWLGNNCIISDFISEHFHVIRKDRNRNGGGVMLLVNKIFSVTETVMHDNFSEIESAWTCCKLGTQKFCLGVIYRPPNSTDIYIQKLLDQMSNMCDYYDKSSVIISGPGFQFFKYKLENSMSHCQ